MNKIQAAIKTLAEDNGMEAEVRPKSITESDWFKNWLDMGFPGRSMDVSINPAHKWQGDGSFFDNGFRDLELHGVSVEAMDLMKAAPELLEAAEAADKLLDDLRSYCHGHDSHIALKQAMAKAKGVDNE